MSKKKKNKPRKHKYTVSERRAFWMGVGACMERNGDFDKYVDKADSKIKKSVYQGYNADNFKAYGNRVLTGKK